MNWTPWKSSDAMPEAGEYWVTATGVHGPETFTELLHASAERTWRYGGVIAFTVRNDAEPRPGPYLP